jgi:hypothetical protein
MLWITVYIVRLPLSLVRFVRRGTHYLQHPNAVQYATIDDEKASIHQRDPILRVLVCYWSNSWSNDGAVSLFWGMNGISKL